MKESWKIAYTRDGGPPPADEIVSWSGDAWDTLDEALEACEMDGWRGYVCLYPSGLRPHADAFLKRNNSTETL